MNRPVIRRQDRRHKFKNQAVVREPKKMFDVDLADFSKLAKHNDSYKFVLVVTDIFSKMLFTHALKTKGMVEVRDAFENIIQQIGKAPKKLRSDSGSEFLNSVMREFYQKHNIDHYTATNNSKAIYAERAILSLKRILYRYMVHHNKLRWLEALPKLTTSFNNTYHSTIRMRPVDVNSSNKLQVWANQFLLPQVNQIIRQRRKRAMSLKDIKKMEKIKTQNQVRKAKRVVYKFKVNDYVRVSTERSPFERVYDQKFTGEIFKVIRRYARNNIPLYKLQDLQEDPVRGVYYQYEMVKVKYDPDQAFKIDRVLKYRTKNKKKEALVRWKYYPSKFDSYIPVQNIKDLK
jgi:hypothetical protein